MLVSTAKVIGVTLSLWTHGTKKLTEIVTLFVILLKYYFQSKI